MKDSKKVKVFKADFIADVYAFFHQTSSTGKWAGSLEVNSKTNDYNLKGENFNWDAFVEIFEETITSDMIKDLVENSKVLRIPIGEQCEGQKNYYKIEVLEKKGE